MELRNAQGPAAKVEFGVLRHGKWELGVFVHMFKLCFHICFHVDFSSFLGRFRDFARGFEWFLFL